MGDDPSSFEEIINYQISNFCLMFYIPHILFAYFLSALAQTNRTPFDTLEAEQELIAGYHTEYSSVLFCVFYISEYTNVLLVSLMITLLFLGGGNPILFHADCIPWSLCLGIKTLIVLCSILFIRAVLPRYRFYNILSLFWIIIIPILIISSILFMIV